MKLLIITQKVDMNDPVLGFFHRWIEEFSKHCESVTVIALGVGKYDLPNNVKMLSLGKEKSISRLSYIVNFYSIIWRERKNYDVVFVHMNQEYVLLGGVLWKLLGKKVGMWRNHAAGNFLTRIAVSISDKVFCTSMFSYTARYKKTVIMPVGIDTKIFFRNDAIEKKKHSLLFLGRISPVKNVDVLIKALDILDKDGIDFFAGIYGNPSEKDGEYYKKIREYAAALERKGRVSFYGGIPNRQTPAVYNQYELFVNATPSGSFDKTILEAMACKCLVVSSNESLKSVLQEEFLFKEGNAADLAIKLKIAILLSSDKREEHSKEMRQYAEKHSIAILSEKLFAVFAELR